MINTYSYKKEKRIITWLNATEAQKHRGMDKRNFGIEKYPLQEETDIIIGIGIEIHKILGAGFLEIVYKDAYEYEYRKEIFLMIERKNMRSGIKKAYFPTNFTQTSLFWIKSL